MVWLSLPFLIIHNSWNPHCLNVLDSHNVPFFNHDSFGSAYEVCSIFIDSWTQSKLKLAIPSIDVQAWQWPSLLLLGSWGGNTGPGLQHMLSRAVSGKPGDHGRLLFVLCEGKRIENLIAVAPSALTSYQGKGVHNSGGEHLLDHIVTSLFFAQSAFMFIFFPSNKTTRGLGAGSTLAFCQIFLQPSQGLQGCFFFFSESGLYKSSFSKKNLKQKTNKQKQGKSKT